MPKGKSITDWPGGNLGGHLNDLIVSLPTLEERDAAGDLINHLPPLRIRGMWNFGDETDGVSASGTRPNSKEARPDQMAGRKKGELASQLLHSSRTFGHIQGTVHGVREIGNGISKGGARTHRVTAAMKRANEMERDFGDLLLLADDTTEATDAQGSPSKDLSFDAEFRKTKLPWKDEKLDELIASRATRKKAFSLAFDKADTDPDTQRALSVLASSLHGNHLDDWEADRIVAMVNKFTKFQKLQERYGQALENGDEADGVQRKDRHRGAQAASGGAGRFGASAVGLGAQAKGGKNEHQRLGQAGNKSPQKQRSHRGLGHRDSVGPGNSDGTGQGGDSSLVPRPPPSRGSQVSRDGTGARGGNLNGGARGGSGRNRRGGRGGYRDGESVFQRLSAKPQDDIETNFDATWRHANSHREEALKTALRIEQRELRLIENQLRWKTYKNAPQAADEDERETSPVRATARNDIVERNIALAGSGRLSPTGRRKQQAEFKRVHDARIAKILQFKRDQEERRQLVGVIDKTANARAKMREREKLNAAEKFGQRQAQWLTVLFVASGVLEWQFSVESRQRRKQRKIRFILAATAIQRLFRKCHGYVYTRETASVRYFKKIGFVTKFRYALKRRQKQVNAHLQILVTFLKDNNTIQARFKRVAHQTRLRAVHSQREIRWYQSMWKVWLNGLIQMWDSAVRAEYQRVRLGVTFQDPMTSISNSAKKKGNNLKGAGKDAKGVDGPTEEAAGGHVGKGDSVSKATNVKDGAGGKGGSAKGKGALARAAASHDPRHEMDTRDHDYMWNAQNVWNLACSDRDGTSGSTAPGGAPRRRDGRQDRLLLPLPWCAAPRQMINNVCPLVDPKDEYYIELRNYMLREMIFRLRAYYTRELVENKLAWRRYRKMISGLLVFGNGKGPSSSGAAAGDRGQTMRKLLELYPMPNTYSGFTCKVSDLMMLQMVRWAHHESRNGQNFAIPCVYGPFLSVAGAVGKALSDRSGEAYKFGGDIKDGTLGGDSVAEELRFGGNGNGDSDRDADGAAFSDTHESPVLAGGDDRE